MFFRCTIFAIVIAILCACSLWKKRRQICGWGSSPRPHSQSGDSAGSCYVAPAYSRCNSFHHAPPPYAEVRSLDKKNFFFHSLFSTQICFRFSFSMIRHRLQQSQIYIRWYSHVITQIMEKMQQAI